MSHPIYSDGSIVFDATVCVVKETTVVIGRLQHIVYGVFKVMNGALVHWKDMVTMKNAIYTAQREAARCGYGY